MLFVRHTLICYNILRPFQLLFHNGDFESSIIFNLYSFKSGYISSSLHQHVFICFKKELLREVGSSVEANQTQMTKPLM